MDWSDDGIVLAARKYGESAAIVTLLTFANGRHAGLVRGASGRRARGIYQPGNRVRATWRARLADHLGSYSCELTHSWAAEILNDSLRLMALSAACAMAEGALPEREPHRPVFDGLLALLGSLDGGGMEDWDWPSAYVKWELGLLSELGFALDLSTCAATGGNDQLAYVSPKSGRAVSMAAAEPYKKSLLVLPEFLLRPGAGGSGEEVRQGLVLTGFFLERNVFQHSGRSLPAARKRLAERLRPKPSARF